MRLISILAVMLIIGYLVKTQLAGDESPEPVEVLTEGATVEAPKVPTTLEGLKNFDKDVDAFVQQAADEREARMKEAMESGER